MSSIGIGLFGTGVAADNHAYAIARSDKFSIVAVADDKYQLAQGFSKRHHIDRCYGDLEYLLEDEGVDIVLLSSPFPFNSKYFPFVAETGRSVIIETPLASRIEEAESIVEKAEEEGIFLFPVSQMVSDPLVSYLFSLIKEGRLGSIKEYSLSWSFPSPLKRWMSVWGNEAGIDEKSLFLLSASPVFDLVYSLFGDEEITSYKEKEDRVEVIFNRGVLSISDGYGGFSFHIKGEKCEIAGKNGKLISINGFEKINGFETESIRTPFSPLASWYNSVYFALESGVWPKEKYMATLKGLKLITQCKKYFV